MTARKTITVAEACELTGKAERTIQDACSKGIIEAYKEGNHWMIYKASVNDYIKAEQRRIKARAKAIRRGGQTW